MKRKGNLYQKIYKFENIVGAFDEVCKNTKNKKKVARFKEYKCVYIARIYNILINKTYQPKPYNVFIGNITISSPKILFLRNSGRRGGLPRAFFSTISTILLHMD